jgi:hypothetical protein
MCQAQSSFMHTWRGCWRGYPAFHIATGVTSLSSKLWLMVIASHDALEHALFDCVSYHTKPFRQTIKETSQSSAKCNIVVPAYTW